MFVMSTVIITGSATLRELNVSHNDIGDDGMAVISETLEHVKSLTDLSVMECGLSVKGTVVFIIMLYIISTIAYCLMITIYGK